MAAEVAQSPRAGSVGRYVELGEIASGGMASIHFARWTAHGDFTRDVVIKRLHPHLATNPEFVSMLLYEGRLGGRIAHANVVPTPDVVVEDDDVFLVMPYVHGLALSQLFRIQKLRGGRIPLRIASGILGGVLRGLHAAHEATDERGKSLEIVHCDVSPQNVLVGVDGLARILDFGVAKAAVPVQVTHLGEVKGKIAYMSPEQAEGGPVTLRADIYASAVVLWEVVTGERLYAGDNTARILSQVVKADVKPPSRVVPALPQGLDEVVSNGTARCAFDRYESARAMADDLDRCVPGASALEISDWLAQVGGELLLTRNNRIAKLDRGSLDTEVLRVRLGDRPRDGSHPT